MPKTHAIVVRLDRTNNVHKCKTVNVSPGDTLVWTNPQSLLVFFEKKSPVVEGRGPFTNGDRTTVRAKPPLKKGERFVPKIAIKGQLRPAAGDIIVT